ncbi:MAG: hypothetical protein HQL73_07220 [Magnetococcales bacterium]|nr:hypothetical protein [Magnetococcales bacterium]
MVTLNLKPESPYPLAPPVKFSFDVETQTFGGPDGEFVAKMASEFQFYGGVEVIPCYIHPLGKRLSLVDLAAILSFYWDLRNTGLPAIPVPFDPDMPEDATY